MLAPSLQGLSAYKQFVIYRTTESTSRPGKQDKFPCDITGRIVSAHDPANWMDAETAIATAAMYGAGWGVGFVFTTHDPFWFLDIDGCLVAGQWSPLAVSLCTALNGCAIEVSQSGTGLHIFGVGQPPAHSCRNQGLGLEFYTTGRFVALTGINAVGSVMHDASAVLPNLVAQYFQPASGGVESEWTTEPVAEWRGPVTDEDLIRRAMNSKSTASAFGNRASFSDLWLANVSVLSKSYPDPVRPYDASSADAALAQHLAFWTGSNCERIKQLMLRPDCGLLRDKYEREDYLPRTILGAVSRQIDVLVDKAPAASVAAPSLTVPSGTADELTPEDFWAHLPSHKYINRVTREMIPVDALNGSLKRFGDGLGMKPAAWLDMLRAVQQMSWQPGYPEVIEGMKSKEGYLEPDPKGRIYNLYQPSTALGTDGDVQPWLDHVRWLYPDEADHIIKWFAQRLQSPGEKVNHALVIGGKQGIGKDLMLLPVRYGVGASNFRELRPGTLLGDFTEWVESTMVVVNEARDLGDSDRYKFYDHCKELIAGPPDTLRCNKKGLGAYYVPNVMGIVFTSNNKLNGLYIDADDRRHFVAWSAVSKREDNYYAHLADWLNMKGGKQAVVGYLRRLDIQGWNPKAAPPKTEAWHQIVAANSNPDETAMGDALEGLQIATVRDIIATLQFKGYLDLVQTLQDKRFARRVPVILERVGFEAVQNPYAPDGRWTLGDGRKEMLYVDRKLPNSERIALANQKASS